MEIEDTLANRKGILLQLFQEDALLVLARWPLSSSSTVRRLSSRGLGLERIFCEMMKFDCAEHHLIFVLGCTDVEQEHFIEQPVIDAIDPPPRVITAEISVQERKELYLQGGLFFVTAR
jgi:hypothetical protein